MDMVDTPRKETQDMNVMELIDKINKSIKIAALSLFGTNREHTNLATDECVQKMKDIRLLTDKSKLKDVTDNIEIAFHAMEMLTKINKTKVANKNVKDIVSEMLDNDDEELTSVSEYDSASSYISDSD